MATRLQQIISAGPIDAGASVVIPHSLNVDGRAVIPDYISRDNMGFAGIDATTSTVTVRNDTGAAASIVLRLRYYHTIDRVYGNKSTQQLTPAPFWEGGAVAIVSGATDLDGDNVAATPNLGTAGGIPLVYTFDIPDAPSANYDIVTDNKIEVIDVLAQKRGGSGGFNDSVTVQNGPSAISGILDMNVGAGILVRPTTIDSAQSTITAGGTLRCAVNNNGLGNAAMLVTVWAVKRT